MPMRLWRKLRAGDEDLWPIVIWWGRYLMVRQSALATAALLGSKDRYWASPVYKYMDAIPGQQRFFGVAWIIILALVAVGVGGRGKYLSFAFLCFFLTQVTLWVGVVDVLIGGQLSAVTAVFHFFDSIAITLMMLALPTMQINYRWGRGPQANE